MQITISGRELQDYRREHYRVQVPETKTATYETQLAISTPLDVSINSLLLSKTDLIIDADTAVPVPISPEQTAETMKYLEFKKAHEEQFRQEIKDKRLSLSRGDDSDQGTLQY